MATQEQIKKVQDMARTIRLHVLDMIGGKEGKVGHLGGSFSCADIMAALYFYKMRVTPQNPKDPGRDRMLMSKGHAVLAQYAALAELGYFPMEELQHVKCCGAMLQGHPDMTKTPGIEANTGSLGQGLSLGAGMAAGLKLDKSDRHVYVIMGDGEIAEGQIWEAAMWSAERKLDNLVGILDCNKVQATGAVKDRMDSGDLMAKWKAFGWHVIEIDGHKVQDICDALDAADKVKDQPVLIFANTVKGKYVSFAEGRSEFHNGALTKEQYEQAVREVKSYIAE